MADIAYATLEIGLSGLGGNRYRVEVRYWPVNSEALEPAASGEAQLDPAEFLGLSPEQYGAKLTECLFKEPRVRERFLLARQDTFANAAQPCALRVRLWFDPGSELLYDLQWERLCEPPQAGGPAAGLPLAATDLVPFSRFLGSWSKRPVLLRPRGDLKVLVLIANPRLEELRDDGSRQLAEVNVDAEWQRAKEALTGLPAPALLAAHPDACGPPTRERLLAELAGGYDILYLVCHGVLKADGPFLLLEKETGQIDGVPGNILAESLQGQAQIPRLVSLAACQSAGTGHTTDSKAHQALGPALVRAGVPAVIAMNGKIAQETAGKFYPCFFAELIQHGMVDRAVSTARRTVKDLGRADWWMPVLYMRLSAGRIWSVPHVREREKEPYEELSLSLQNESCTPILGPGLLEPLWGSASTIAREWAELRGFPLSPHRTAELPTVAQFLARRRAGFANRTFVVDTWMQSMETTLMRRWPGLAAGIPGLAGLTPARRVSQLVSAAGAQLRQNPADPYRILASLPVSIYLTTTPDPLLADALRAANREPLSDYVRWTEALKRRPRSFDENSRALVISRERPLVFHLLGSLEDRESLVLTEDDFFDYLISVVKDTNNTVVPNLVRTAWSSNALMLLGFDLDEWAFRVLYRLILQEEGHKYRLKAGTLSAAVQLNPEEERNLRPDLALPYFEQVFESDSISLSWSQPADFLREVWQRLPPAFGGPA